MVAGAAVKSTARRKTGVGSRRSARRAVFSEGSNRTVIEEKEKERGKKEGGRVGSRMRDKGSLFCGVVVLPLYPKTATTYVDTSPLFFLSLSSSSSCSYSSHRSSLPPTSVNP